MEAAELAAKGKGLVTRPVRRVVDVTSGGRKLVIEVHPLIVRMREAGRHDFYDIPWGAVFTLGARMQAIANSRGGAR